MTPHQKELARQLREAMEDYSWNDSPLLKMCEGKLIAHFPHLAEQWTEDYLTPMKYDSYVVLALDSEEDYQQWLKEQNDGEETSSGDEGQQEREPLRQEGRQEGNAQEG
jgi:hypothetical protein